MHAWGYSVWTFKSPTWYHSYRVPPNNLKAKELAAEVHSGNRLNSKLLIIHRQAKARAIIPGVAGREDCGPEILIWCPPEGGMVLCLAPARPTNTHRNTGYRNLRQLLTSQKKSTASQTLQINEFWLIYLGLNQRLYICSRIMSQGRKGSEDLIKFIKEFHLPGGIKFGILTSNLTSSERNI